MTEIAPTFIAGVPYFGDAWRDAFEGLQEGVIGAGDLKVTPGAARNVDVAAGLCMVQGDYGTDSGLYRARNDAAVSSDSMPTPIAANASGNPRIDQVVARVYDTDLDSSGLRLWRLEVVAGTASVGATLDNRTGAAALPSSACRLADVLVPNGFTGPFVQNTHIRDRRPWAYRVDTFVADSTDTGTSSTGDVQIGGLAIRAECSGAPVVLTLSGLEQNDQRLSPNRFYVDGAAIFADHYLPATAGTGETHGSHYQTRYVPSAGSHLFSARFRTTDATRGHTWKGALSPTVFGLRELPVLADNSGA